MHLSHRSGTDRRSFIVFFCAFRRAGISQVAVKSLLVYASDQNGEGLKKKTKASTLVKPCVD
jgi:hypothetical protein